MTAPDITNADITAILAEGRTTKPAQMSVRRPTPMYGRDGQTFGTPQPPAPTQPREPFRLVRIGDLGPGDPPDWLVRGYMACGGITLMSGYPKAGKSTLLTSIIRDITRGGPLAERRLTGPVLMMSEEPTGIWANRRDDLNLPPDSVLFVDRETHARPSMGEWRGITSQLAEQTKRLGAELVVIDTLGGCWPVVGENDAGEVLEALAPLRDISAAGACVLLIHHTRKSEASHGTAARGSIAIPGFVDCMMELRRHGDDADDRRRLLSAWGRWPDIPGETVIEFDGESYTIVGNREQAARDDRESIILSVLPSGGIGMTADEVRAEWPEQRKPSTTRLRGELVQGARQRGLWQIHGTGLSGNAYRFTLHPPSHEPPSDPDTPTNHPP